MVGVCPPDAMVSVAPPAPPQTRFCAPDTEPEVLDTAVGHTVALDGVSTLLCQLGADGHGVLTAVAADADVAGSATTSAATAANAPTAYRQWRRGRPAEIILRSSALRGKEEPSCQGPATTTPKAGPQLGRHATETF
jgi:hypothetical protein